MQTAEKPGPAAAPLDTAAPARNFSLTVEDRLRAFAQGPLGYMRRRRRIEELEARLVRLLAASPPPPGHPVPAEIAADLATLDELVDKHNRYYPIEANLPIDVRTGRFLDRGVPWQPLPRITLAELVRRAGGR